MTFLMRAADPPAATGEPSDPGSGYLWSDDFDRYASIGAMRSNGQCQAGDAYFGIADAAVTYGRRTTMAAGTTQQTCNLELNADGVQKYELITGRSGSGNAIRSVLGTASTSQGFDYLSPWGGNLAHTSGKSLVVQFWIRISSGWHPQGVGGKYLLIWTTDATRARVQFAITGGTDCVWRPQDGPNTSGFFRTPQPVTPHLTDINDGQWHRMTHLFKCNTSSTYVHTGGSSPANETYTGTSSRDGRIAMWVDGTKIMDFEQSLVGVTPPGGANPWCYQSDVDWIHAAQTGEYCEFPSTINDSASAGTIDHDDMKVWEF